MALLPGVVSMMITSVAVSEMESLTMETVLGMVVDSAESLSRSDPLTLSNVPVLQVQNPVHMEVSWSWQLVEMCLSVGGWKLASFRQTAIAS